MVDARGAVGLTLRRNVIEGAQELRPDQLRAAASPFAPTADTRAFFEHPFVRDTLASRAYADLAARARGAPGFLAAVPLLEPAPHVGLLFRGAVASGLLEGLPAGPPVQAYADVGLLPLVEPVSPEERSRIAASAEASAMAGPHGPATPSPENGIGPGTRIVGSGGCTANFVFTDGAGNAYLGTAGHCVLGGADEARDFDPGVFACVARCGPGGGVWVRLGPVLYARQNGPEGPLGNDFAWVLIPRELHHLVRPWMWLWGGPTGVAGALEPVPGQPLVHYGHGFLIGALFPTRGRAALSVAGPVGDEPVVVEDEPVVGPFYSAVGDVAPGDSGSPIATAGRASRLLVGDKAMGDITHGVVLPFVLQAPFFVGTTVERALRFLEEETGVRLEVRVEDRPLVEPFTLGVDLAGSRGARLEHNLLHMAGGGCRPGDGACADPPVSAVAAGATASGATLARNRLVADAASGLLDQRGPVLGGTRGVDGSFEGSSIGGNVLRQWAGGAVVLRAGGGNVVEDNLLDHNGAGVVLCSSAGNEVLRNTFLAHDAAVLLCGASEANVLTRNSLGPTNAAGLALAGDTASLRVDARLNCWGAQTLSGVRSRVRDEGVGNAVEVVPFLDADCATPILPPVAGLAAAPNPADRVSPVQFRDTSEPGGRPIAARLWEFGDGSTGTEAAPQHTYTQLGTFTARLTVTNAAELSAAAQLAMRVVNVPPLAAFGSAPEPSNRVDPTQFGDASADRDGSIVGYLWDLGDGATSTERDPQHTYAQLGTHLVTLTVTDNDGAEATATRAVEVVNLPPSVDFTFSPAHPMVLAPVRFHGHGSDRDGEVAAWSWDLGNGLASDAQDPVTVYTQGGFHDVTLTVTDDDGGVASATKAVFVCAPGVDLQALVEAGRVRVELQGCIALSAPPLAGAAPPWLLGGAGGEPRALASAAYAPTRP